MSIFPIILIIVWILRAVTSSSSSGSSSFGGGSSNGGSSGGGTPARQVNATQIPSWFGWFLFKLLFYAIAWAMLAERGDAIEDLFLLAGIFLFMPTLMARAVFIPLGMFRTAYWTSRWLRPSGYGKEYRLAGCVAAALALTRKRNPEQGCAWLEQQLPMIVSPHVGYDMLLGLLAAIRGERDTAYAVFHLIDTTIATRYLRCTARDWLVADAAARGDWQDAIWRGKRGVDSFRWSYAVARMAERIARHAEAPPDWLLVVLWLRAPRRLRLLPLLRTACALPRAPKPGTRFSRPRSWQQAMAPLGAMLCEKEQGATLLQREQFVAAIHGAAANLVVPAMRTRIEERLHSLAPNLSGAGSAEAVISSMRAQLTQLVHTMIEHAPQLAEDGATRPVIGEAIERMRLRAMQDIETRAQDFAQRTGQKRALGYALEWAAWGDLRARAERLLRLAPQAEDSLFDAMYVPMCNFAVYQHNEVKHHRLAHDIFCWLHRHAASNPEAAELLIKNAQAFSGMRKG